MPRLNRGARRAPRRESARRSPKRAPRSGGIRRRSVRRPPRGRPRETRHSPAGAHCPASHRRRAGVSAPALRPRRRLPSCAESGAEAPRERANVVLAAAQRRNGDRMHVQAVKQIFAETAGLDPFEQIFRRRRDQPDVGPDRDGRRPLARPRHAAARAVAALAPAAAGRRYRRETARRYAPRRISRACARSRPRSMAEQRASMVVGRQSAAGEASRRAVRAGRRRQRIARAKASLPTPASPSSRTGAVDFAARSPSLTARSISGDCPAISAKDSASAAWRPGARFRPRALRDARRS